MKHIAPRFLGEIGFGLGEIGAYTLEPGVAGKKKAAVTTAAFSLYFLFFFKSESGVCSLSLLYLLPAVPSRLPGLQISAPF